MNNGLKTTDNNDSKLSYFSKSCFHKWGVKKVNITFHNVAINTTLRQQNW